MRLEPHLVAFESASSIDQLTVEMQKLAETYGFASFNFIDAGRPDLDEPFWKGTTGHAWEADYLANHFVQVDPTLSAARRTNTPFTWSSVRPPVRRGPKTGSARTFEAAEDHGFRDGIVMPLHLVDRLGRPRSSCVGFFWTERKPIGTDLPVDMLAELYVVSVYWMQCMMDMVAKCARQSHPIYSDETSPQLITPKEKDVLAWSARGKTASETADIIGIAADTVEWHFKNARRKLDATTKTHAVTKAVRLGLIDV